MFICIAMTELTIREHIHNYCSLLLSIVYISSEFTTSFIECAIECAIECGICGTLEVFFKYKNSLFESKGRCYLDIGVFCFLH